MCLSKPFSQASWERGSSMIVIARINEWLQRNCFSEIAGLMRVPTHMSVASHTKPTQPQVRWDPTQRGRSWHGNPLLTKTLKLIPYGKEKISFSREVSSHISLFHIPNPIQDIPGYAVSPEAMANSKWTPGFLWLYFCFFLVWTIFGLIGLFLFLFCFAFGFFFFLVDIWLCFVLFLLWKKESNNIKWNGKKEGSIR